VVSTIPLVSDVTPTCRSPTVVTMSMRSSCSGTPHPKAPVGQGVEIKQARQSDQL
jgi:hypothetical protein